MDETEYDRHAEAVLAARKQYVDAITEARAALGSVAAALDELSSNELYDVEYAEGGQRVIDMEHYLNEATRSLRVVEALNTVHQREMV